MSTQVLFQSPMGAPQGSRVKIRGHMTIAHRTPSTPGLLWVTPARINYRRLAWNGTVRRHLVAYQAPSPCLTSFRNVRWGTAKLCSLAHFVARPLWMRYGSSRPSWLSRRVYRIVYHWFSHTHTHTHTHTHKQLHLKAAGSKTNDDDIFIIGLRSSVTGRQIAETVSAVGGA